MEIRNKVILLVFIFSLACYIPLGGSVSDSDVVFIEQNKTHIDFLGTVSLRSCASCTVTVTAQFVNIRNSDGVATGEIAQAGDVLTVTFRPDGYALISSPAKWAGMLIWRGCTSDAGSYGCEAK